MGKRLKQQNDSTLDTDAFVKMLAEHAKFSQADVRILLNSFREVVEHCISEGIDIDLRGLFNLYVQDITYTKPPGIVKYQGATTFNKKAKRLILKPALNLTDLLREEGKKKMKKPADKTG